MKAKLLRRNGESTFAIIFDTGDVFMETLKAFVKEKKLTAAQFTAIGVFRDLELAILSQRRRTTRTFPSMSR